MKRQGASLKKGTLVDYSSASRITTLYGNDMAAIRTEYSRQRSIIRKRVERMAAAGETSNITYQKFGNVAEQLPTVRSLTDSQVLEMLTRTSGQIAGGYNATLSQVREARARATKDLRIEAEAAGDTELATFLSKPMTPAQYRRIGRLTSMLREVALKIPTGDVYSVAAKEVLGKDSKESLFDKAKRALKVLGIDEIEDGTLALERIKQQFTSKGTTRISWKRAHSRRGN